MIDIAKGKYEYWAGDEGKELLEGWARDGLTDEKIAKRIGIRRTTLYAWKRKYADISDALKKGKEIVDYEVENALLAAAKEGNVTAMIFWLKNRRPDKWRDKPVDINEGLDKINANVESLKAALLAEAPDRSIPEDDK